MIRDVLKYVGGLVLAVLLLWWVFHGVGLESLLEALRRASIPGLILCGALQSGHNVFRVLRWRALLYPVRADVPMRPMFAAVFLGYMVTWVVPGRLGEVVRPALLSAKEDIPLAPCLGTVVIDRLMDTVGIVVMFVIGVLITPLGGEAANYADTIRAGAFAFSAVLILPLIVLMAASIHRTRLERFLTGRTGILAWIARSALGVSRGTEALRSPFLLGQIVFYSIAAWFVIAVGTWIGIEASGVDVPLGGVMVMLPMLAIGVAIPTPGGAGGYHAMMKAGLVYLLGVPEAPAVSAGILVHLTVVFPVVMIGTTFLWTEGISWHDMLTAARQVRGLGAEDRAVPETERPLEEST